MNRANGAATEKRRNVHPDHEFFVELGADDENYEEVQSYLTSTKRMFIRKYIKNTMGPTHDFTLEVDKLWVVKRPECRQNYKRNLRNKRLLFHGTSAENVYSILQDGFDLGRASDTGMFGPGIYFSDCCTKAAIYACPDEELIHESDEEVYGYLFLCEVALGKIQIYWDAEHEAHFLLSNFNSVYGQGSYGCTKKTATFSNNGVLVCPGPIKYFDENTLNYNEYIVYDTNQIKIKYLVKVRYFSKIEETTPPTSPEPEEEENEEDPLPVQAEPTLPTVQQDGVVVNQQATVQQIATDGSIIETPDSQSNCAVSLPAQDESTDSQQNDLPPIVTSPCPTNLNLPVCTADVPPNIQQPKAQAAISIPQEVELNLSGDKPLDPMSFPEIVSNAQSQDQVIRRQAVTQARQLLSSVNNPPIDALIECGIVPILVQCLQDNDPNIQIEAAWVLTNIASGTCQQTHSVVTAGAVPHLIHLLASENPGICEQAIWALGNIIGDGPHYRDYCIELGIIDPLVKFVRSDTPVSFLRNVAWVIVNLCRSKEPPPPLEVCQLVLSALIQLIHCDDTSILIDTLWAIAYITDVGSGYIQIVIDSGILKFVVPLLVHTDVRIVTPILRCLGTIATGSDEQTQSVLDYGALNYVPPLFGHTNEKIKKEAVWFISNIAAGTSGQIQSVIDAGLFPRVIELMSRGEFLTQKEAAWAISNITLGGTPVQIWYLVEHEALKPMCSILSSTDTQIIQIVLEALFNTLKKLPDHYKLLSQKIEECGGLKQIEQLQNHPNEEIYKLAYAVIDEFFSEAEEEKLNEPEESMFKKSQDFWRKLQL